jgi:hypothetical protein
MMGDCRRSRWRPHQPSDPASRRVITLPAALLGAAIAFSAPTAHAQGATTESATAQALFDAAKKLVTERRFAEACPKFEESQRLDPASGTLLNLASCYEQLGKWATAWARYLEAAAAAKAANQLDRKREAQQRAEALHPRLSYVVIDLSADAATLAGLQVQRDQALVGPAQTGIPVPVDPGEHHISATAPGREPWETSVATVADAQKVIVTVPSLAVRASAAVSPPNERLQPPSTQRTLAIVVGGVGVAGGVVGTIYALRAITGRNAADDYCSSETNLCREQAGVDLRKEAGTSGNVATIAFMAAAAGIAGGAVLWLTAPQSKTASTPQLGLGPGSVFLRGTW